MNLYEPLLERDESGIRNAIREFRRDHTSDELFATVARFAVLAYAPSQHGKHSVLCCLSAYEARDILGEQFDDVLTECAIYAAASRQPWSEPPITDPPPIDRDQPGDAGELRACIDAGDHLRAERWLARRLDDPNLSRDLFRVAADDFEDLGHKLIMAVAAWRLAAIFGEQGRYATLRIAVWEMTAYRGPRYVESGLAAANEQVIGNMVACGGDVISAHGVFLLDAALQTGDEEVIRRVRDSLGAAASRGEESGGEPPHSPKDPVYRLARDYGACLKSLSVARRLGDDRIIAAARYNLEHAPSFEEFTLA